jgi:site-specific DNA-methyltransferase (adenine-specific)
LETTIKLENASCFDFLPKVASKSIDLILIDPPYKISRETGFSSYVTGEPRFAVSMDFGDWDYGIDEWDVIAREAYRVLKTGGTFISFYDLWKITELKNHLEKASFKQIRLIEWLKTNPVPINSQVNYLTNAREIALLGVKGGKPTFNSKYHNGVYQYPICQDKGRFHPTQKPVKLLRELIEIHSNPGDVVLDCFSGSGTTAVAARDLGRSFVGCELDPDYFEKSLKRIK